MILQTDDKPYRSVSFRSDLHNKFSTAANSKSPVKLSKFRLVANKFDSSKKDVEVNHRTLFTDTTAEFEYGLPGLVQSPTAEMKNVHDILVNCQDKEKVSVTVYMSVEDRPTIKTSSLYHNNPVFKKEVCVNDDSRRSPHY